MLLHEYVPAFGHALKETVIFHRSEPNGTGSPK
jgi:hypothetical protein